MIVLVLIKKIWWMKKKTIKISNKIFIINIWNNNKIFQEKMNSKMNNFSEILMINKMKKLNN